MIPNAKEHTLVSNDLGASSMFGISRENEAHIMGILRDTLYSDKILAVIREYASNAWDAHRDAGKSDLPIKVTMPTRMDPTLSIRDFGTGISRDDIFKIYTQYGASTKRNSNNSVGQLGIGCKSAYAYTDSFTITSYHGGAACTKDVCDICWGTGDAHKHGEDLRKLRNEFNKRVTEESLTHICRSVGTYLSITKPALVEIVLELEKLGRGRKQRPNFFYELIDSLAKQLRMELLNETNR